MNATNQVGKSALHYAALYDYFEIAKLIIQNGADLDTVNIYLQTPLHDAVANNHFEIVKLLIENGADVNAVDTLLGTPLYNAVLWNSYQCIKLLIKYDSQLTLRNNYGKSPIDVMKTSTSDQTRKIAEKYE